MRQGMPGWQAALCLGLMLAMGAGAGAQAGASPPAAAFSRQQLRTAVLQALIDDPALNPYPLAASVDAQGKVTLDGRLPNQADKDRAEEITKAISGVRGVHNQIRVDPAVTALVLPGQGTPAPAQGAGAAAQPAGAANAPSPGSDAAVQSAIADALRARPELAQVSVAVRGTTVRLDGDVANAEAKARAGGIAAQRAGSRKVVNQIRVGPGGASQKG